MRTITRYSEAFKLKVVNSFETGKLRNLSAARELYGIPGGGTIQCWLKKYGKNHLLNKVVRVETADERSEIKKLKEENKKLKANVSDLYSDFRIEQVFLKIACKKIGETVEEFKKKADMKPPMN